MKCIYSAKVNTADGKEVCIKHTTPNAAIKRASAICGNELSELKCTEISGNEISFGFVVRNGKKSSFVPER